MHQHFPHLSILGKLLKQKIPFGVKHKQPQGFKYLQWKAFVVRRHKPMTWHSLHSKARKQGALMLFIFYAISGVDISLSSNRFSLIIFHFFSQDV